VFLLLKDLAKLSKKGVAHKKKEGFKVSEEVNPEKNGDRIFYRTKGNP